MTEPFFLIYSLISLAILLSYCLLMLYFNKAWNKLDTDFPIQECKTKVSIILPARNEEKNIEACINALAQQNYPKDLFEIIVVNDASTDQTHFRILNSIQNNPKTQIQFIDLPANDNHNAPKKRAIQNAVERAQGDLLITSDADCTMGTEWLASLVSYYQTTAAKMIVGPIKIKMNAPDRFLFHFQNYELMNLVACGGASLQYHKALLCNGANLAFEKTAYMQVQKEILGNNLASGDDMFLMLAIEKKFPKSIYFIKVQNALVETHAQPTWSSLFMQRKRWASKGLSYQNHYLMGVSFIFALLQLLLLTTGIISFLDSRFSQLFLLLFLTKFSCDSIFLIKVARFFKEKISLLNVVVISIVYPLFILWISIISLNKNYTWKDRKLN